MRPNQTKEQQYSPARGEILSLFPTTMFRGFMPLDTKQVCDDVRDIVKEVEEREENKTTNYTTYFIQDIRDKQKQWSWWNDFSNVLKDSYIEFITTQYNMTVRDLNRQDIHLFAWVNRYTKKHWHDTHNHVNALVSGTYYPLAEGKQPIKFFSPSISADFGTRAEQENITLEGYENCEFWGTNGVQSEMRLFPRDGEFLLWPSHLLHGVGVADHDAPDDYERISISFNLDHRNAQDLAECRENGTPLSYDFLPK